MGLFNFRRKRQERKADRGEIISPPVASGSNLLRDIENRTNHSVSIETQDTEANLSRCHLQQQSPLFCLPAEIRNIVSRLATQHYNDPNNRYSRESPWYRPGHAAKHKYSTGLLQTCRRAWLETNALPLLQAEHCFWFKAEDIMPKWCVHREQNEEDRFKAFLESLTSNGLQNLTHIHFFAPMYWLQASVFGLGKAINMLYSGHAWTDGPKFVPQVFSLTIRSSDWYEWVDDEVLQMKFTWLGCLLASLETLGVQTFRLELETVDHKAGAMSQIIERIKNIEGFSSNPWNVYRRFPKYPEYSAEDHRRIVLQEHQEESTWAGFDRIYNTCTHPEFNLPAYVDKSVTYRVITLIWKRVEYEAEGIIGSVLNRRHKYNDHDTASSVPTDDACVAAARMMHEERWRQQGSLLKFENSVPNRKVTSAN